MKRESIKFEVADIRSYIIQELVKNQRLLFNELDLQMFVAKALEQVFKIDDGYIVHLEYRLPKGWSPRFDKAYQPWGETPYFDIVIEDKLHAHFIGIELKYKLKQIDLPKFTDIQRFGCCPPNNDDQPITLVTNQAAENEGRYDFWKDVKRLELLGQCFENVVGGIAIFVTNQQNYKRSDETNSHHKYSCFNLTENEEKKNFLYWIYDKVERPASCHIQCGCGEEQCLEIACGERLKRKPEKYNELKDGKWGSKLCHFVRPNFSLNHNYRGILSTDSMKICIGTREKPKIEEFYCYSVLVPNIHIND